MTRRAFIAMWLVAIVLYGMGFGMGWLIRGVSGDGTTTEVEGVAVTPEECIEALDMAEIYMDNAVEFAALVPDYA